MMGQSPGERGQPLGTARTSSSGSARCSPRAGHAHRRWWSFIELAWQAGQASALEHREVAKGRDVGTVIASVKTADGRQKDVPYDVTFAFVVHAFHPEIAILKG